MKQNSVDSILDEDFNFQELKQTVKSLINTSPGQEHVNLILQKYILMARKLRKLKNLIFWALHSMSI